MKVLVTGHCGFIGQNFVKLYRNEHDIIGVDKLSYASNKDALNLCGGGVGDICNKDHIEEVFRNGPFDLVFHFAAESHVDNSISCPDPFIQSNIIGTYNLLEACRKYKIGRLIHISTDEVYGDLQINDPPFYDVNVLKPSSPYSASKASADMLVLSYVRTYGLNAVITRSCNNYGPNQFEEKFIPVVIKKASQNKNIPVYGDGLNMREWIWVNDNCEAIMAVALNGKSGECYNIGSGTEYTNINIVKMILDILKKPESLISYVEDRKGHDKRYFLDSSKTLSLGWEPKMKFKDGIKQTVSFYV